jgi:hypothetical protein
MLENSKSKKMKRGLIILGAVVFASTIFTSCGNQVQEKATKNHQYVPNLGDIGDLFGGGDVGDPPNCSTFEDIEKWGKLIKTNDEEVIKGVNIQICFFREEYKIRIIDLKETKWIKAIQFRILNGENRGKVAWGLASHFRLTKSKMQQDKESYE